MSGILKHIFLLLSFYNFGSVFAHILNDEWELSH